MDLLKLSNFVDVELITEEHLNKAQQCLNNNPRFRYPSLVKFQLCDRTDLQDNKRRITNEIDNDSIDINFQEMRGFIDRFFGENFTYSFIDNDPAKATQIAVYNLVVSGTTIPLEKPLCFKRNIDYNGTFSFPNDKDIRQLIEYGFILELVEPLQYYQENSSSAYPVYQLVYNPKDTHNYETNLQLLNALAKRGDLGKFNTFFTDLKLSLAF